jgi:hypothetical protein
MNGKLPLVRFCKVISIDDDTDADRIKVRLSPEDNDKTDEQLDYAFPLLPKMFHVKPKKGEAVFIFLATANDGNSQRYYIGPVISQDHRIFNDQYFNGADSFLRGAYKKFDTAPRMNPDINGLLPNDDDVVIRGRKNSEIQISENDVTLKAGVKLLTHGNNYDMSFNEKNPGYVKTKYHLNPLIDGSRSSTSIVSDKIFLVSNTSPNYFKTTDREHLLTDDEYNKLISKAYKLPYGELLVEFLNAFVTAFIEHTHPFSMLPPNPAQTSDLLTKKNVLLDRGEMLSDTVRIN